MGIKVFEKCFVKTSKGIIAMAFYESYGTKRWGVLAPLDTIDLCESQFIKVIKDYCFVYPHGVFVTENDKEIHFGFEAYQWYLQGICKAKPIEEYLDETTSAYCILKDNKGRQRIRKFTTSSEMERIIQARKPDILAFGLVKKGQKIEKDISRYVLISEDKYVRYDVGGNVSLCDLKNATIFPSKRFAEATAKGCKYSCKAIKYDSAKTYNGRRYVIALTSEYRTPRYICSVTQIGFDVSDDVTKGRRFYKKQGENFLRNLSDRFSLTPRTKFELVELNIGGAHNG